MRRKVSVYSLPMILAVGYRVRSPRGTQFRQWATAHLEEYLVKGFVMDDQRLKDPGGAETRHRRPMPRTCRSWRRWRSGSGRRASHECCLLCHAAGGHGPCRPRSAPRRSLMCWCRGSASSSSRRRTCGGWIFGGELQAQWTRKIYRRSFRLQNPLRQTRRAYVEGLRERHAALVAPGCPQCGSA